MVTFSVFKHSSTLTIKFPVWVLLKNTHRIPLFPQAYIDEMFYFYIQVVTALAF